MRNSIILNDRNSSTITGLLVQELPPITKPQMRANIELIDGRDGDIVTNLGYSAYDKTVSIGLHGNFDIDEVIGFFNDAGSVIFSNESDKLYYYQILNQIDYERLVRFRTASVVFHVQPFKYPISLASISFNGGTSSNPVTVTNGGNVYARPTLDITGSGTVGVYINGDQVFSISLDTSEHIIIDCEKLEASYNGVLKNRQVTGDYDGAIINPGNNTIYVTGTVSAAYISNYKRWL